MLGGSAQIQSSLATCHLLSMLGMLSRVEDPFRGTMLVWTGMCPQSRHM